ncbi:MAG: toprim domain-containing protein [Alistipes sp.]|nr:toprim domain-containing protein [Bacteroidales bacterium]MBR5492501.1 toprim domain-containing protein [Alistipes sp.]MBR5920048.1 toprim domain-containing protein [Bacteroidales bacterium]
MIDWQAFNIDLGRGAGRTSGYVKTYCPNCHENGKPKSDHSLSCNVETGAFKCHRCGWQGYATVTTQEEKETWMRQQPWYKNYSQKKTTPPKEYAKPPKPSTTAIDTNIIGYFAKRGISEATLKKMHVTSGTDWMPVNKEHRKPEGGKCTTIHFNYIKDGELVATKLRSGDKCFRQAKAGCEQVAYNLDGIKNATDCYIVEGEFDALSLVEIGYNNVVSVPDGGSDRTMHWLVDYYEEYFADKKTVYICSDNDGVGGGLANELAKHFEPGQYVIVNDYGINPKTNMPNKDANDCLVSLGPDALRLKLSQGKTVQPEGDVDMDSVADEMDDIIRHGLPKGLPVGLPNLDPLMRIQKGRLYILTGTPGSGKSQFLDHLAVLMNARYGWRFSVYSPEMMPLGEHLTMFLTKYLGKQVYDIDPDSAEYTEARNKVKEAIRFIDPDSNEIDDVLAISKFQCRKYGCEAMIIDPWNSLLHHGESLFKVDNINEALLKILNFVHRQDIAVFVMPHPTNQQTTKDGKPLKIHLYNISGGAMFRNRGDFGMVMTRHYKDDPENTFGHDYVELAIEKTKWEYVATLGTVYFRYEPGVGRFHPFDPATGDTQWMQRSYLTPMTQQEAIDLRTTAATAPPSEANVQGFLEQARRQEQAQQPRQPMADDEDIFNNQNDEETPY